ncbi:MAG TPA: ester cyclase [Solirubrobacteraceae bacterium]|nr:ester cyclase [Solirubrobacteraceae bacterium]
MSSDAMTGAADPAPATADLADASRRLLEQSFNTGDFELIDQLVAREALQHDPALPAPLRDLRGPDGIKRTVTMYRTAFPDLRMTVDDAIASGDKVALRWHSEGTHRGELAGLAPTGVHGSVTGISIDRWQDGKIVEVWAEWDNMGLARLLGAAPPEGSVGEKVGMGLQRLMARWMRRKNPL